MSKLGVLNKSNTKPAALRKWPTMREVAINILTNGGLFIISLYLIWIYYGWSASYSSTYITVYSNVSAAQSLVANAAKSTKPNPTASAYSVCLSYGWLMLPRPLNDAYGYTNFWIQYNLSRHIKPGLSLFGYNDWVKLLS